MTNRPHDALFKAACTSPKHAAPLFLLRSMLPPAIAGAIDWSSLENREASFIDENLSDTHADLLFTATLAEAEVFIYVLLEHQSTPDGDMPLRMLRYMERIWSGYREEHPRGPLPVILPCVISQALEGWTSPVRFSELLEVDLEAHPSLRAHVVPDFELVLDDLSRVSDEELRSRSLDLFPYLALRLMRDARRPEAVLRDLREWAEAFRAVYMADNGPEAFSQLMAYLYQVADNVVRLESSRAKLIEVTPEAEGTIMTLAEKLVRQGRAEGLEKGREEGREEGKRGSLERVLRARFGALSDEFVERLQALDDAELDEYIERAATADSIEAALGR